MASNSFDFKCNHEWKHYRIEERNNDEEADPVNWNIKVNDNVLNYLRPTLSVALDRFISIVVIF